MILFVTVTHYNLPELRPSFLALFYVCMEKLNHITWTLSIISCIIYVCMEKLNQITWTPSIISCIILRLYGKIKSYYLNSDNTWTLSIISCIILRLYGKIKSYYLNSVHHFLHYFTSVWKN